MPDVEGVEPGFVEFASDEPALGEEADPAFGVAESVVPGRVPQGGVFGLLGFTVDGLVLLPALGGLVEFAPGTVDEVPGVAVPAGGVAGLAGGVADLAGGVAVPGAGVAVPVCPEVPVPAAGAVCATSHVVPRKRMLSRASFLTDIEDPSEAEFSGIPPGTTGANPPLVSIN